MEDGGGSIFKSNEHTNKTRVKRVKSLTRWGISTLEWKSSLKTCIPQVKRRKQCQQASFYQPGAQADLWQANLAGYGTEAGPDPPPHHPHLYTERYISEKQAPGGRLHS